MTKRKGLAAKKIQAWGITNTELVDANPLLNKSKWNALQEDQRDVPLEMRQGMEKIVDKIVKDKINNDPDYLLLLT